MAVENHADLAATDRGTAWTEVHGIRGAGQQWTSPQRENPQEQWQRRIRSFRGESGPRGVAAADSPGTGLIRSGDRISVQASVLKTISSVLTQPRELCQATAECRPLRENWIPPCPPLRTSEPAHRDEHGPRKRPGSGHQVGGSLDFRYAGGATPQADLLPGQGLPPVNLTGNKVGAFETATNKGSKVVQAIA